MAPTARRAFLLFHLTLGLVFVADAARTLLHALREHGGIDFHLGLVIGLRSLGAVLFLVPRTVRVGGVLLLLVLLGGFAVQVSRGEWELRLLVYAAGVWLVMNREAEQAV